MGRRLSDATTKVLSLLEDGKWHSEEKVILKAMTAVPPNVAFRVAERARAQNKGIDVSELGPRVRGDEGVAIRSGQRSKARDSVNSMLASGRLEKSVIDGQPMIRLRRGIPQVLHVRAENAAAVYYRSGEINVITIDLDPWPPSPESIKTMLHELDTLPATFPNRRELVGHLKEALKEHERNAKR